MKIKTKFTLATAAVLFIVAALLLCTTTVFIIHESLLVRRHDLRTALKRVNRIMSHDDKRSLGEKRALILEGIKFVAKKGCLKIAVFDLNGKLLVFNDDYDEETLRKKNYPTEVGDVFSLEQWISWHKWDTDVYYTGEHCYVKLNDRQQIEIEDDILLFFFVLLSAIVLLSWIGGAVLGNATTRQVRRVERAATLIAGGDLSYRIPETSSNDEMAGMERDLNGMFAELEQSFNRVMEFSSDLAHELRTPLTIMTGDLEVALREDRSLEEYQRVLARTMEEVASLRTLVNDMLVLVKPNSAYSNENFENFDFSLLLSQTVESLDLLADTKKIKILENIQDKVEINGNHSFLKMLIYNLLHNAIKYTGDQGVVTVSLSQNEKNTTLTISDNGPGIPAEERNNVFKRFYRLRRNAGNESSGTGLGLAIVKKVCEVHNAEITLDSSNKGSTFTVVF